MELNIPLKKIESLEIPTWMPSHAAGIAIQMQPSSFRLQLDPTVSRKLAALAQQSSESPPPQPQFDWNGIPILRELRELSELCRGWDGEDAEPIAAAVIGRAAVFVSMLSFQQGVNDKWRDLHAVPCADGTAYLEWTVGERQITLHFQRDNNGITCVAREKGVIVAPTVVPSGDPMACIQWVLASK